MRQPTFLLAAGLTTAAGICIEGGVSENERLYVPDLRGKNASLLLSNFAWDSARLVATLVHILLEEALGYHVASEEIGAAAYDFLPRLSGCLDLSCSETNDQNISDIVFNIWYSDSAEDIRKFTDANLNRAPEDLGSLGYAGIEGLFLSGLVMDEAYEDLGLSLEYYRSYNKSHHNAKKYFADVSELNFQDFRSCTEQVWATHTAINLYLEVTGDTDGVVPLDNEGNYRVFCPDSVDGRMWIAPACRTNVSQCIPCITTSFGWGLHFLMQQSTAHGLPLAMGIPNVVDSYATIPFNKKVMFFSWVPDATFVGLNPTQVSFPPHNANEWLLGNYRTTPDGSKIGKMVTQSLRERAPGVVFFLEKFQINQFAAQELLVKAALGTPVPDVACEWLQSNKHVWEQWIPRATSCPFGRGMVNIAGDFVSSREEAVGCSLCPPGTFSKAKADGIGRSYECTACDPGSYQDSSGQGACLPCSLGRMSDQTGVSECALCGLGSYANATGMTHCIQCSESSTLWTTSHPVMRDGVEVWIQLEGSTSKEFCGCREGWFLHDGMCQKCLEGSSCPGSSRLELLAGYASAPASPGDIFMCYGDDRCPGGPPGTCAEGWDPESVACASCQLGLTSKGATCRPCEGGDYVLAFLSGVLLPSTTALAHVMTLRMESRQTPGASLLDIGVPLSQIATSMQLLTVMMQIRISWEDPFVTVLGALSLFSPEALTDAFRAISCVAPLSPVGQFVFQNVFLPVLLMLPPVFVHALLIRGKRCKWHLVGETLLGLYALLIIVQVNSAIAPFRCEPHPNGQWTMQGYHTVFCSFQGQHLHLCLIGAAIGLVPCGFLSLYLWLLMEIPKRVKSGDVIFLRACKVVILRFRPGSEYFAAFLLLRNILFACIPMIQRPSLSLLLMQGLLGCTFGLTCYFKPWRTRLANFLDMAVLSSLLSILTIGAFFLPKIDPDVSMIVCTVVSVAMLLALVAGSTWSSWRRIKSIFVKPYRFFMCHHKADAGNLARLLKMELLKRMGNFKVFMDTDDLTDLTCLFNIVSNDVEMLVVLGTSKVITRKWCLGEITSAHTNSIPTVIVAFPGFQVPLDENMDSHLQLPGVADLASYNIGFNDLRAALQWLRGQRILWLQEFTMPALQPIVDELTHTKPLPKQASDDSRVLILADPSNPEAVAAAYILAEFTSHKIMHSLQTLPTVMLPGDGPRKRKQGAYCLLVCSVNCFLSPYMAEWILEAGQKRCSIVPVLADEDFHLPSEDEVTEVNSVDASLYFTVLRAIFIEIMLPFSPGMSSEDDLNFKASKIARRLQADVPDILTRCTSINDTKLVHQLSRTCEHLQLQRREPFEMTPGAVPAIPNGEIADCEHMVEVAF